MIHENPISSDLEVCSEILLLFSCLVEARDDDMEAPRPSPFILSIQDQLRLIGIGSNQTPLFCANVISVYETSFRQLPIGSVAMWYGSKVGCLLCVCHRLKISSVSF